MEFEIDEPPTDLPNIVEVEVIIEDMSLFTLLVKTDENSNSVNLPRSGVQVTFTSIPYALLSLSETKAITYGLI